MSQQASPSRDRTLLQVGAFLAVLLVVAAIADLVRGTGGGAWLFGTSAAGAAESAAEAPDSVVFRGVLLFDGEAFREGMDVRVRDGVVDEVGKGLDAAGASEIDGAGRTLVPGLIDAHTHTWGDALRAALVMGVTAELDMFTTPDFATQMRAEQAEGRAGGRADLYSAGYLVTAPGGHGTEYGIEIPTLEGPDEAEAFVRARVAEGADFIKIVVDDGFPGREIATLDIPTVAAVIEAAHALDKLAVVHVSDEADARAVVEAGADGIVHVFYDAVASDETVDLFREHGAFVVPTLAVIESVAGGGGGAALLADERVAPYVMPVDRPSLETSFPGGAGRAVLLERALESVRRFHAGGVRILAGTDAPNPGTAHGYSMHRELELLARAGLDPAEVLGAATTATADAFGLEGRGRVRSGARADLVLLDGDPRGDITVTRAIEGVWKAGERFDRAAFRRQVADADAAPDLGDGAISDFEEGAPSSLIGSGWQISTDQMMGGTSTGEMSVIEGGAADTARSLEVSGEIAAGGVFAWSGPMLMPGAVPFTPTDLSAFDGISFWLRGDGPIAVMLFSTATGQQPVVVTRVATPEWTRHELDFTEFTGVDPARIQGLLFSAVEPGEFIFGIDEVALR